MTTLSAVKFAELDFNYDREKLEKEILSIRSVFEQMPASMLWARPHKDINVGTHKEILTVTVIDPEDNIIHRELPSWEGLSLTYIPGQPKSVLGGNRYRNTHNGSWSWRDDVEVPYLKELVESLQFEELHSVRIMVLPAGSIGLVHVDSTDTYYLNNISVTLNVNSGGSPIIFKRGESTYSVEEPGAFLFQDNCPHGVPRVYQDRVQVRINGRPNKEFVNALLKTETIVQ